MIEKLSRTCLLAALAAALAGSGTAQVSGASGKPADDRAGAYYNFAMGHLYAELAATYGYRSEYVAKAIEHYKAALKADPGASFLSEELTDLFIQAGRLREAVTEAEEMLKRDPENLEARRILGRIYARLIGDPQNRVRQDNAEMLKMAIEQYTKIVEKDAKDVDSWVMLGRLRQREQDSVEAEKAYKKALELDPKNEYAMAGLAQVYAGLGDTQRALEMWRRLADQNPTPRALRELARRYEEMHEYAAAAETLKRALALSPKDLPLKKNLAEDLLLSDQVDAALKLYEEVAQADPKDASVPLRLSQVYRQKRDLKKAREAQERARALDPESLELRYNEVNLLEAEGRSGDAIAKLKELIDITTKKSGATADQVNRGMLYERLGLLYRASEQFDLAVEAFQKLESLDPDAGARAAAQMVDTYRQAKQFAKAEQLSENAVKKFPNDRTLKAVRSSLLADLGRADEAAAILKELLDGKADRETWLALAQIYDKGKNYAEMAKALDAVEKLSDSDEEKETVHFMRGAMFEKAKKLDEAEAEFRKVLEIDPQNSSALNYLGYMLADRGVRLEEAHRMIARALELEPNNGAYLDSLGWVLFKLGKHEDAEQYLRRALERVSRDPVVHDHLGDVLMKQGKVKEAIAQWEISLREWEASSQAERDPAEVAKVQKKLETARVRLAKEPAIAVEPRRQ